MLAAKAGGLDQPHVISLPEDATPCSPCLQIYGSQVPKSGGVKGFVGELAGAVRLPIRGARSQVEQGEGEGGGRKRGEGEQGGRKRGKTEDGPGDGKGPAAEGGSGEEAGRHDRRGGAGEVTVHGVLGYFTAELFGGVLLDSRHSSRSLNPKP